MSNRLISLVAFTVLALFWLAFGAALLFNKGLLDETWQAFRDWPLIVQVIVGLLLLPVVIGLWIWETTWPLLLRLVLVASLAFATVYVFFPKKVQAQTEKPLTQP
jgi:hypothetical protein